MAVSRPAAKKHSRERKLKARYRDPLSPLLQLEEPLRDVSNYIEALRLIGHGLIAQDDNGGDAIVALAWAAEQRLETVKKIWNRMLEERRRARRAS